MKSKTVELSELMQVMIPDQRERELLLQHALRKLHPNEPGADGNFEQPINMADLLCEMQRTQQRRKAFQAMLVARPDSEEIMAIIRADCDGSLEMFAYMVGLSEETVRREFISRN